ncbi:uncharacterized protein LOC110107677 isoform X1 [Dendrobium catenatum]|uniref:uncharacterized protein LOC110107677 isoform X1 n=1 Tax=Dendrobium catenatum TaxID=906689 RepID=UPI0009F4C853|nr:uncharacterized protein LOC110107677 isoform X1 [Dendrobium catenatum]
MKRGAKRAAISDSSIDPTDVRLRCKRVMEAPSFGNHIAESSHQDVRERSPLDVQRANLSLQHVRALNTQFASWVQSQLQNHLDELWIDGVKDYQSHASNILEEFKDVVEWLRENAAKSQSNLSTSTPSVEGKAPITPPTNLESPNAVVPPNFSLQESSSKPASISPSSQIESIFVSKSAESNPNSDRNLASGKMVMPPTVSVPQTPSLFFNSQSRLSSNTDNELSKEAPSASLPFLQNSSLFFSSQSGEFFSTSGTKAPIFSGGQFSTPQKVETGDPDEEGELEQPSSPSLKKIEEKGVSIVHEVKCKVYIKDSPAENRWKDMGTGHLSIKCKEGVPKATKESKPTIIVRNDAGRILLNALIYPGIKMNIQKTSIVSIFHTAGGEQGDSSQVIARTYLLRLKSLEDTTKLAETIKEYTPST